MPALTPKVLRADKHIDDTLPKLPDYIQDYVEAKRGRFSPLTLSGYLYDYVTFLNWLRESEKNFTDAKENKDIPYEVLEKISLKDISTFFNKMQYEILEKKNTETVSAKRRSTQSVARYINSLKSLYNYLTEETDIGEGESLFNRNVMKKIEAPRNEETASYRSRRIERKTYSKKEVFDLLGYVENDYESTLTPRQKKHFIQNKRRDLALLAILIGSGVRGNELVGLHINDVYFTDQYIDVIRKGSKPDSVSITKTALKYIEEYLAVRNEIYRPSKDNSFLFLSVHNGKTHQLSNGSLIRIVKTYTRSFGKEISPHKLRYTFGKLYQDEGGTLTGLKDQLGHEKIETTSLYVNSSLKEHAEILNKIDSQ